MTTPPSEKREVLLATEIAHLVTAPPGNFIVLRGPLQPEHSNLVAATKTILAKRYVIYDSIKDVPAEKKKQDPNQSIHTDLVNGIVFDYVLWPKENGCVSISHVTDTQEPARYWMSAKSCWGQGRWNIGKSEPIVVF